MKVKQTKKQFLVKIDYIGSNSWTGVIVKTWEFDPGSEWTLAACLTHASRTKNSNIFSGKRVSNA